MRLPCLKQAVRCYIVRENGQMFVGVNSCKPCDRGQPATVCPREFLGCPSGEDYEICDSTHAEIEAVKYAQFSSDSPGEAFIFGHTFICGPCQRALAAINVHRFTVVPKAGLAPKLLADLRRKVMWPPVVDGPGEEIV